MECQGNISRSRQSTARKVALSLTFCAVLLTPSLRSQVTAVGDKQIGSVNDKPAILTQVGVAQNLNQQLPLGLTFTDDEGKQVQLASYFGTHPAILALVYYRCPMLCSEELNGLASSLRMVDEVPGKDFNVIAVSIDPTEGAQLAAAKKRNYLKLYGHPETAAGWHFLTGTQQNIDALTKAVGFQYAIIRSADVQKTQFAHASTIQVVTPEGKLAQYYLGVEFSPKDLRLGLAEASNNRIGSPVDNILTYCYHYDPLTNKQSLIVARVVQAGGFVTVMLVGGFMLTMFRRDARRNHAPKTGTDTKVDG